MAAESDNVRPATDTPGLVMYCRSWCGDCRRARQWLDERGIAYTEIDVEEDEAALGRALEICDGRLHTPTFELGEAVCIDFQPDRLEQMLRR